MEDNLCKYMNCSNCNLIDCLDGCEDISSCQECKDKMLTDHDKQIISDFANKIKNHMTGYCQGRIDQQYCAMEVVDYIGGLLGEKDFSMNVEEELKKHDQQIRDEVIEEFVNRLMNEQIIGCMLPDGFRADIVTSHTIDSIAEQMKERD